MNPASTREEIIEILRGFGRYAQVSAWTGDLETVVGLPSTQCAAFVALAGGRFQRPAEMCAPAVPPRVDVEWDIIIKLPAGQEDDALAELLTPAVSGGLSGHRPAEGGTLWPVEFELLWSNRLSHAYRITFNVINIR